MDISKISTSTVQTQQSCVIKIDCLGNSLPVALSQFEHAVFIFDKNTALFKDALAQKIASINIRTDYITLDTNGEKVKSLDYYLSLVRQLPSLNFLRRKSCLVAVGGGTVIDLVGFVAATYQRGVSYINIPTTLLAMVDASIGGKVGINLPEGKHLIGEFHYPQAILIDTSTLSTLEARQFQAAWGEILKIALISEQSKLWNFIEDNLYLTKELQHTSLEEAILASIEVKLSLVEADWEEQELDRLLNLGHEVAHALEAGAQFNDEVIMHGEAVLIGLIVTAKLAQDLGYLAKADFERIFRIAQQFCNYVELNKLPKRNEIARHLYIVEHIRDGNLRVVLPYQKIGQAKVFHNINPLQVADTTSEILEMLQQYNEIRLPRI